MNVVGNATMTDKLLAGVSIYLFFFESRAATSVLKATPDFLKENKK